MTTHRRKSGSLKGEPNFFENTRDSGGRAGGRELVVALNKSSGVAHTTRRSSEWQRSGCTAAGAGRLRRRDSDRLDSARLGLARLWREFRSAGCASRLCFTPAQLPGADWRSRNPASPFRLDTTGTSLSRSATNGYPLCFSSGLSLIGPLPLFLSLFLCRATRPFLPPHAE